MGLPNRNPTIAAELWRTGNTIFEDGRQDSATTHLRVLMFLSLVTSLIQEAIIFVCRPNFDNYLYLKCYQYYHFHFLNMRDRRMGTLLLISTLTFSCLLVCHSALAQ